MQSINSHKKKEASYLYYFEEKREVVSGKSKEPNQIHYSIYIYIYILTTFQLLYRKYILIS